VWCHDDVQRIIPIVRYGLVVLFFSASALDKIFNFQGAVKQALQVFLSHRVAAALILVGVFVELVVTVLHGLAGGRRRAQHAL